MKTPTNLVAVVTGASAGLGLATAEDLAKKGYTVYLTARNLAKLEKETARLKEAGLPVRSYVLDVTRAGDAEVLVGDTGIVCEVGDDAALAAGIEALLREDTQARAGRCAAARSRICETYSVEALARTTESALLGLLTSRGSEA